MTDTSTQHSEDLWAVLRRRKLVQWGLAYAAGAWGFQQGLAYVSTLLNWPVQVQRLTGLALLIGLPLALVLAWYHGDRGQQRITTPEFAILTLLLLLGGGAFWYYQRANETHKAPSTAVQPAAPAAPLEAAAAPDEKSIAVLPFVDMSAAKDQEYMSDGIAEELLNLLAEAPDLKVIARTSSFAFKGEKIEVAEIAKRLNVAHVLEGSVRTSGNKLRITAQLIRTADSTHLWSETYDRTLDDIFAVQDEIAGAIAKALQIRLTGEALLEREARTENRKAYELFLRAWNGEDGNTEGSLDRAERYLLRAIELDPNYSMAMSALAANYVQKVELGYLDANEGFARARQLARQAIELNPESAHAHVELQYVYLAHDWDWAAAAEETQRALELDPMNPYVLWSASRLSATLGQWDTAIQQLRTALTRDPLEDWLSFNLGFTYCRARRFAEAETTLTELLEIAPDLPWTRSLLGAVLVFRGKPQEALVIAQEDPDEAMRLVSLPIVLRAAGRHEEADKALLAQIEQWGDSGAYYVALTYAHRDDHDRAFEWLERAYKQKDPALLDVYGNPFLDNLADDPRFEAFLQKMKLPEWPRT